MEKFEEIKIDNKKEFENLSSNSLDCLSIMFKSYVKDFDDKKLNDNKMYRSTLKLVKPIKNEIIEEGKIKEENQEEKINLCEVLTEKLTEIKKDTLVFFESTRKDLEEKYNQYIKYINDFLLDKENQISKIIGKNGINDNCIFYTKKNLFKQIDEICDLHKNIMNSLEDHVKLLYSFLEQTSLLHQKNPLENFIKNNSNEIFHSWILNKINYEEINISTIIEKTELSEICSDYIGKKSSNEISTNITIEKDENGILPIESKFLTKHYDKFKKIKFIGINKNDSQNILNEIKNKIGNENISNKDYTSLNQLCNLNIINSDIVEDFSKLSFPNLKKLKIKNSTINLSQIISNCLEETRTLIELNIEKIKMSDYALRLFFRALSQKKSIQESLKYLSLKGNELTKINLNEFRLDNCEFTHLVSLDLSKNNIFEFSLDNLKYFQDIEIIDLTDNNISNCLLIERIKEKKKIIKFICLLSNNIFIHNNNKNNLNYINYLSDKISNCQYRIKKLSFSLLFNKNNLNYLTQLKLSPAVKISLCKLDISFCGLNDEALWKFFKNNYGFLNLEELNLSNNFLSDKVFELCSNNDEDIPLSKLHTIDLSGNEIFCRMYEDLKFLENFVDNHHELNRIKLQNTNFLNGIKGIYSSNDNIDHINLIIKKLIDNNIKIVIDEDLFQENKNTPLDKLFIYKNKNY